MASDDMVACTHCQRMVRRKTTRRGLCAACDTYQRKWHAPRPLLDSATCRNPHCDRPVGKWSAARGLGLCRRCLQYKYRTGNDWTPDVARPGVYGVRMICADCRQRPVRNYHPRPLCVRCYNYWLRNGKRRPRSLDAEACKICGRPRSDEPRTFVRGRCRLCYDYYYRTGRERPRHLWGVGEFGWCDCGQPATHQVTVRIGVRANETLALCDGCYAEEMRYAR